MTSEDFQACVAGAAEVAAAYAAQRAGTPNAMNEILDMFTKVLDAAAERAPVDEELEIDEDEEEEEG